MNKKVIVGISGGVDSAVSLKILCDQGYDIEALYMKNWDEDDAENGCNAAEDLEYAFDVSQKLNVKLHTANFSDHYWNNIFLDFIDCYKNGLTPNPDILCNKYIKFKVFIDHAKTLGAQKIATGHYAKIIKENSSYFLTTPKDIEKDQTYFLHTLNQNQLSKTLFPLSDIKKSEVKNIAKKSGFRSYDKKESMGICFIGNKKFKRFIAKYIKNKPGDIVNENNEIIGEHNGIFYTTIGQREGIGIGGMKNTKNLPWYVYKKDIENNKLFVCQGNDNKLLFHDNIFIKDLDIISSDIKDILNKNILCQVRHLGEKYKCSIEIVKENLFSVKSKKLIRAPAQGQSLVIFENNKCLGGGIITNG